MKNLFFKYINKYYKLLNIDNQKIVKYLLSFKLFLVISDISWNWKGVLYSNGVKYYSHVIIQIIFTFFFSFILFFIVSKLLYWILSFLKIKNLNITIIISSLVLYLIIFP